MSRPGRQIRKEECPACRRWDEDDGRASDDQSPLVNDVVGDGDGDGHEEDASEPHTQDHQPLACSPGWGERELKKNQRSKDLVLTFSRGTGQVSQESCSQKQGSLGADVMSGFWSVKMSRWKYVSSSGQGGGMQMFPNEKLCIRGRNKFCLKGKKCQWLQTMTQVDSNWLPGKLPVQFSSSQRKFVACCAMQSGNNVLKIVLQSKWKWH